MMRKLQQSSWQRLRSWERRLKSPRWLFRSRREKAEEPLALFLQRKLPRQQPISWGLDIDKKKIVLNDPIKAIGSFEVAVKLHKEVTAKLAVKVVEA